MKKRFKLFISAGEVSADLHGAKLVQEIRKLQPSIQFIGMGSTEMKKAGVHLYADLTKRSTMGILEPIRHIPFIYLTYLRMKRVLKQEKPDLVVVIDFQGYHMVFIAAAKKLGIPVVYYISPQEWQWGTEEGGRNVNTLTDLILAIFPEEAKFYNRLGGNAKYVGHPMLDIVKSTMGGQEFFRKYGIPKGHKILAVFPGSRPQEIKHSFPVLIRAADEIQKKLGNISILVSTSQKHLSEKIRDTVERNGITDVFYYGDRSYELIANSNLSLTKSGTITLEHALLGTPFIAGYRFGKLSFMVIKKMMEKKWDQIKYISLPNLLLRRKAYPEFIQDEFNVKNVVHEGLDILKNPRRMKAMKINSVQVRKVLGNGGAVKRAALHIVNFLKREADK